MIGAAQVWQVASAWVDGIAARLDKTRNVAGRQEASAREISILCLCRVLYALMTLGAQHSGDLNSARTCPGSGRAARFTRNPRGVGDCAPDQDRCGGR
jgi:hypothetical protein